MFDKENTYHQETDYVESSFHDEIWPSISEEITRVGKLKDEEEKERRYKILFQLMNEVNGYEQCIKAYQYKEHYKALAAKGIRLNPLEDTRVIKKQWEEQFTSCISRSQKADIDFDQYRWHVFSYEVLEAKVKSAARQAFDEATKNKLYVFYQHKLEGFMIENSQLLESGDFDRDEDIYVYNPEEGWTYVHTHEMDCGPYFYSI